MTNYDVVQKMLGQIEPVGETNTDNTRFINLKKPSSYSIDCFRILVMSRVIPTLPSIQFLGPANMQKSSWRM